MHDLGRAGSLYMYSTESNLDTIPQYRFNKTKQHTLLGFSITSNNLLIQIPFVTIFQEQMIRKFIRGSEASVDQHVQVCTCGVVRACFCVRLCVCVRICGCLYANIYIDVFCCLTIAHNTGKRGCLGANRPICQQAFNAIVCKTSNVFRTMDLGTEKQEPQPEAAVLEISYVTA